MQRSLIDDDACQERIAILLQRNGQTFKPIRPLVTTVPLDLDLIDHG
jgi:hypothetical protein